MATSTHETNKYSFNKLKLVTPAIIEKLNERYSTLESLRAADFKEIQTALDVSSTIAARIKKHAMALLADSDKKTENAVHTKITAPLNIGGRAKFTKGIVNPEDEDEDELDENEYVAVEKRIDKFNQKRSRVLLTPAVCRTCGFDLIAANKLLPYVELKSNDQRLLREALEAHIAEVHNISEAHIIKESQKKDTTWLRPSL